MIKKKPLTQDVHDKKNCPICGFPNIEWILPNDWSKWKCKDCGYIGTLIIDNPEIAKKIQEEFEKKIIV